MKAIKAMGTIDEQGKLSLDDPLLINKISRVEVIILLPEELEEGLPLAIESFRQGWQDAMTGNTIPIAQLWDKIDAD